MQKNLKNSSTIKQKKLSQSSTKASKYKIKQIIKELKSKCSLAINKQSQIIREANCIFSNQPTVLKLNTGLIIVGDLHGQFYDLLNIFEMFEYPPRSRYLFLGDYIDRGRFCIELITLLLVLKINYPNHIFMLRGNHEGRSMTTFFNFKKQCEYKYNSEVYEQFLDLFKTLPLCAIINDRYFAVHAGLSPQCKKISNIQKINRFQEIPTQGAICDLLWSDPIQQDFNYWVKNTNRSCSYYYSRNHSKEFLKQNTLNLIIRGHEVALQGYKYLFGSNKEPLVLTVFSAPHYCDIHNNQGAVVILNGKNLSVQTYKQVSHPFVLSNYMNAFEVSIPLLAVSITKMVACLLRENSKKKAIRTSKKEADYQKIVNHLKKSEQNLELYVRNLAIQEKNEQIDELCLVSLKSTRQFTRVIDNEPKKVITSKQQLIGPRNVQFKQIKLDSEDDQVLDFQ